MTDSITKAVIRLFNESKDDGRFYAELLMQMDRIVSKKVPTLGVCIKENIQLHVNMEFFDNLKHKEQVALLKHECKHILNDHIPRMRELEPSVYAESNNLADNIINSSKHQILNIAADCSINVGIPDLPSGGCYPKLFKLPDNETFEFYANALKNSEELKELNNIGDHSLWSESEGDKEELKEKIKSAVKQAAENAKSCGSLSSELELLIDRLNYVPKSWKRELHRFAARALEVSTEVSRKKRNRRYGIMYPGTIKEEKLHIGVAIDTSGSISDEALNQFMSEIGNISKYALVTVVEADSEVKNSYVFDPKKTYKVTGRGGTAYQPAFDYFNKNTEVDGVIYFGDMDAFDSEEIKKPRYPVLWAIIGTQSPPVDWGARTLVEVKKRE